MKFVKKCPLCKKEFKVFHCFLWRVYCSYNCRNEAYRKKVKRTCQICNKIFYVRPSSIKNGAKFCSRKCFYKRPISIETRKKMGFIQKGKIRTCETRKRMSIGNIGQKNHNWRGGKIKTVAGYFIVWKPQHPFANSRGYVLEHRLVMEKHLKRFLQPKEVVHHINENRQDNRIENLQLFRNRGEHIKFHFAHK